MMEGYCLSLNEKESAGLVFFEKPEYIDWISACRCKGCGQIITLFGAVEFDHTEKREMGPQYFYYDQNYSNCPNCGQDIDTDLMLTEYAYCWDYELDLSGAESILVEGLKSLAERQAKLESRTLETETLEKRMARLKDRIKQLKKQSESKNMYVLIVEGKDDQVVWEQFLLQENTPIHSIEILKYGDGGLDEAIKAAVMFRGRKLKMIPHKLIIDSDNNLEIAKKKLEKRGISESDFHILQKKEIDAYLLDQEAISQVLSINAEELEEFCGQLKGVKGKETLEAIGNHFIGRPLDSQSKGLIARAMKNTPEEIHSIISEIRAKVQEFDIEEDYEDELSD